MPKVKKQGKRMTRQRPYARGPTPASAVVQAPQARSVITRNRAPVYIPLPDGGIRVKHREMIGYSAVTATGFSLDADSPLYINPSLPGTFPWLSSISDSYEKWRPVGVKLIYVPLVSAATSGNVIMACDYDANDALPTTATEIEQNKTSISGPVWSELSLELSTRDMLENVKAYYTGPATNPGDRRMAYAGQLIIAYDGMTSISNPGKFYLEYVIDLLIPQQPPVGSMVVTGNLGTETINGALYAAYIASKEAQRIMHSPPFYDPSFKTINIPVQGTGGYNVTFTQDGTVNPFDLFDLASWSIMDAAGHAIPVTLGAVAERIGISKSSDSVAYGFHFRSPVEKAILQLVSATPPTFASGLFSFVVSRITSKY